MSGLIHIYCGQGKGKTTAAAGLSVRSAGRGIPVLFVQFLKGDGSGEIKVLRKIEGIRTMHARKNYGFLFQLSDQEREEAKADYQKLFQECIGEAEKMAETKKEDSEKNQVKGLLVLDELAAACRYEMVDLEKVIEFLKNKPDGLEVVITGREPDKKICELGDYITIMKKERHPFDQGIPARSGIEM